MNFYASTQRHNHLRKKMHNHKWNGSKNIYELKTSRGLISIFSMTRTREQNTTNSSIHHCLLMTRSLEPPHNPPDQSGPTTDTATPTTGKSTQQTPPPASTNQWTSALVSWTYTTKFVVFAQWMQVRVISWAGQCNIYIWCVYQRCYNHYHEFSLLYTWLFAQPLWPFFWWSCAKMTRSNLDLGPN